VTRIHFEYAILGALIERPMHGYDLYKSLSVDLGRLVYVGMSNMYAILKQLESEGHVASTPDTGGNRPPKKIFSVTDKGRRLFMDWISTPVESIRDMRVDFLTKLYFLKKLDIPGGRELVTRQKGVCHRILESIGSPETRESEFAGLLFDFRRSQIESILSWLDRCLGFVEAGTGENRARRTHEDVQT